MPPPSPVLSTTSVIGEDHTQHVAATSAAIEDRWQLVSGMIHGPAPTSSLMSSSTICKNLNDALDRSPTQYPVFSPLKPYEVSNMGSSGSESLEALRDAEEDWLSPLVLDDAVHPHALDMQTLQHTLHPPGQHAMSASAARLARANQKLPAVGGTSSAATLINRHKIESRPVHITSIHPNPTPPRAAMVPHKHKPRIRSAEFPRHAGSYPDIWTPPPPSHSKQPKASTLMKNSSTNTSSLPPPPPPPPPLHTHASSLHDPHNFTHFRAPSTPRSVLRADPSHAAATATTAPSPPLINCNTSSSRAGSSDNGCTQSCDKCLPGSRMTVVPLMDSCDYTDIPSKERDFPDSVPHPKSGKVTNHPIILWFRSKKNPVKGSVMKAGPQSKGGGKQTSDSLMMEKERESIASVREKLMNLEEGKENLEMAVKSMKQEVSQANEKRDAALVEVFELKMAMEEMGKKLENLEGYCQSMQNATINGKRTTHHQFKNAIISATPNGYGDHTHEFEVDDHDHRLRTALTMGNTQYIGPSKKEFYHAVTEARVSIKQFCRTLLQKIQEQSATEKIETILQPYNVKVAPRVSKSVRYHLEALINEAFYEDFENIKFQKSGTNCVLDPQQRPQAFYKTYVGMSQMGWSELVSKESTTYSQSFDAFCDHKMNRVEQVLNWEGRWPDDLARSFFVAAKWVWLLHLLTFSFHHPALIFRVGPEAHFHSEYMEELLLEQSTTRAKLTTANNVAPTSSLGVKVMVMPGFFFNNYEVIKCKVLLSRQSIIPN